MAQRNPVNTNPGQKLRGVNLGVAGTGEVDDPEPVRGS